MVSNAQPTTHGVHRALLAVADPRSPTPLSRCVSATSKWLYKYCGDAIFTYFRAVEIAYRFIQATSWHENDPDVYLAALVIASKLENEMDVPLGELQEVIL